jgi:hypothetical protein
MSAALASAQRSIPAESVDEEEAVQCKLSNQFTDVVGDRKSWLALRDRLDAMRTVTDRLSEPWRKLLQDYPRSNQLRKTRQEARIRRLAPKALRAALIDARERALGSEV